MTQNLSHCNWIADRYSSFRKNGWHHRGEIQLLVECGKRIGDRQYRPMTEEHHGGQKMASMKWLGLKLDCHGDEPFEKDLRDLETPSAEIWIGEGTCKLE